MKIVIIGAGRRGYALAKKLKDHDIIFIDNDEKKCQKVNDKLDCIAKVGSGIDVKILEQAGVENADYFIALTDKDEVNLISSAIAKNQFDAKKTIACVKNMTYTNKGGLKSNLFGLDYIINPEEEAANSIINSIEKGVYSNIITFDKSTLVLYNIKISSNSILKDKTLIDARKEIDLNFIIACISRGDEAFVPSGQSIIKEGDVISISLEKENESKLLKNLGSEKPIPKKIIFQGLNQITSYILNSLSKWTRDNIILLDRDLKNCQDFSIKYPKNLILNADIMQDDVLEEENLINYDLFVALEDSDEKNTITSLLAKKKGIYHSIALLKRDDNLSLKELDIDLVVSATESTVTSLYTFFQKEENIFSFHSIFRGQIEVDELQIVKDSKAIGKKLKEIDIRNKGIVAGVKKENGDSFLATGDYQICLKDSLLLLIADGFQKEVISCFSV